MTPTLTLPIELQLTPKSQALVDSLMKLGQAACETITATIIGSAWQGGKYAGISAGEDGKPDHPLALLPHKADKAMTWEEATRWAASFGDGSRLPTKREAALLYANLKDEFETSDWHWTSTPYSVSDAWIQGFDGGFQDSFDKSSKFLCRAVR